MNQNDGITNLGSSERDTRPDAKSGGQLEAVPANPTGPDSSPPRGRPEIPGQALGIPEGLDFSAHPTHRGANSLYSTDVFAGVRSCSKSRCRQTLRRVRGVHEYASDSPNLFCHAVHKRMRPATPAAAKQRV